MAHDTMKNFINGIKLRFPFYFKNVRVLDFGSLDINGNNKELFFENVDYVGVDIGEGKKCRCRFIST